MNKSMIQQQLEQYTLIRREVASLQNMIAEGKGQFADCIRAEMQEKLAACEQLCVKQQVEIVQLILCVPQLKQRLILQERYLNGKKWRVIAKQTGYSHSQVFRLHREGIQTLEQLIGESEKL